MRKNFKEDLSEWQDLESAMLFLGKSLGVFECETPEEIKKAFWSMKSETSCMFDFLYDSLHKLKNAGVLEFNSELGVFRWDSNFKFKLGAQQDSRQLTFDF